MTPNGDGDRYLLLHRALRNAGDALIHQRARRLIAARRPEVGIDHAEGWRPLADQVEPARLRRYRAVIVAGGPGYAPGLGTRYPVGGLETLPPLVLFALGCGLAPGTRGQVAAFRFDDADRRFLETVLERAPWLGARDPVTAGLLAANGFDRVLMTGDPAWYDLERLEAPPRVPDHITRMALTPPANPAFFRQARRLFLALAAARPDASITVVHHRGVQRPFSALAAARGWEEVDITGSVVGFRRYDEVDLHVGYRVHAHLYATSRSILSYLLAEDVRGLGMLEAMPGLGLAAYDPDRERGALERRLLQALPRVANAHRRPTSWLGLPSGRLAPLPDVAAAMIDRIGVDEASGFPAHHAARATILATLPTMHRMIDSLP